MPARLPLLVAVVAGASLAVAAAVVLTGDDPGAPPEVTRPQPPAPTTEPVTEEPDVEPAPAVVLVHGGCRSSGSVDRCDDTAQVLADPITRFPAQAAPLLAALDDVGAPRAAIVDDQCPGNEHVDHGTRLLVCTLPDIRAWLAELLRP